MSYRIVLEKENFKFSGSHFTIFGPGSAERLHGHNYYVTLELRLAEIDRARGLAFDFNLVKPLIRDITTTLDEHVLLPEQSEHLKLEISKDSVRAVFSSKRYEFPIDDVKCLPLSNVSSEELARYIAEELKLKLAKDAQFQAIEALAVGVEETRGQSVFYELQLKGEKGKTR